MQTLNISNLRKDLYKVVDNVIQYEAVRVNTKTGNAIILSEEEYLGLLATAELCAIEGMQQSIIDESKTPLHECIKEEDFQW